MVVRKQDKTTLLPQALRERIEQQDGLSNTQGARVHSQSSHGGHGKKGKSRKATREAERAAKKQRKAGYFAHRAPKQEGIESLKRKSDAGHNERPVKRRKVDPSATPTSKDVQGAAKVAEITSIKHKLERLPSTSQQRQHGQTGQRVKPVKKRVKSPVLPSTDQDEDTEIAWLEYQLGLGPGKKSGRGGTSYDKLWKQDGLGDLLEGLDGILGGADDGSNGDPSNSEEEEEPAEQEEKSSDESYAASPEINEGVDTSEDEGSDHTEKSSEEIDRSRETELAGSKYVPPHLRPGASTSDQLRTRLLRQLKGLINRLSEQNVTNIISELEQIYREQTRHDVTSSLTSVVIDAISSNSSLLDNHIALNAALVAALYRTVGIEFAAHFVQEVVQRYEIAYENAGTQQQDASDANADIGGKDAQNLLVCIAELYNFEVVSCVLMYDIVRALLKQNVGELEVELLLKILRIGGRQLRQDDPLALKDIVQLVTENVAKRKGNLSSRTRFMVETLTNLKNNRIKKTDASSADTVERMKKMLTGLSKQHHGSHEPLRVTLEDLHSAESKGKWWLVGAGWAGDPLADLQRSKNTDAVESGGAKLKRSSSSKSLGKLAGKEESESDRLLQLAKTQGMNTDIRRSIFVVLMSSDDYVDACDRLSQLTLTEQQQREIVRVLLHCCGNEKAYNPYYALVGQRLLATSHAHRITAQFTLWDFLRSIGETGIGQRGDEAFNSGATVSASLTRNMAKFYGWLIARGSLSISALRPINYTSVQPGTLGFLDTLFYDIFVNSQGPSPILSRTGLTALWQRGDASMIGKQKYDKVQVVEIFMPAVRDPNLSKGLIVYLSKFVKRKVGQGEDGERRFFSWAVDTAREVLDIGSTSQSTKGKDGMEWE